MNSFFSIFLRGFSKKAIEQGFYFLVVCGIFYLAYVKIPPMVVWLITRQDTENARLRKELNECDSLNRAVEMRFVDSLLKRK
jgi:hypothetical protein